MVGLAMINSDIRVENASLDLFRAMAVRQSVLRASGNLLLLLDRLHAQNEAQEKSWHRLWSQLGFLKHSLQNWGSREAWNEYNDRIYVDQLLSHSRDKCELIYFLAILNKSQSIIECGTSFGVTTIYLALAICRNIKEPNERAGKVLTIEKNTSKVVQAKKIWHEAGEEIENCIDSRNDDLLKILAQSTSIPDTIDLLFLDAWTSLAFPALKLALPRLRSGSVVVVDKTTAGAILYHDLLTFIRTPENGFLSMTIPFAEGFEIITYQPQHVRQLEAI